MKKLLLVLSISLFSNVLFSQSWVEVGLKGGYGMDFISNKNIVDDTSHVAKFSFGNTFGGKVGYNFNYDHGITLDVLYSTFNKRYQYMGFAADSSYKAFNKDFRFQALDFLLMYRHVKNASYFEIGPQYSVVRKGIYNDTNGDIKKLDVADNLVKNYFSAVIGAGGMLAGTENFRVILGFRVQYTFTDIVSPYGQKNNFPTGNEYDSYKKTNPISAMMVLELNYDLGFLTSSNCKNKRTTFMFFK